MTAGANRRIVVVTRKTPLEQMLRKHGTRDQAKFYLETRQQDITYFEEIHAKFHDALGKVMDTLPSDVRRARVEREDLSQFLFAPEDVVVIVGQDGLVPNVAKYLHSQLVMGINPDPETYDGVLCRLNALQFSSALSWLDEPSDEFLTETRVMALATRENGQSLRALNEIFVGHRTHQSARYRLISDDAEERQSSSGLICSTGTGATGWALSIASQRDKADYLLPPQVPCLTWFVREPFPSVSSGTKMQQGHIPRPTSLQVISEMGEDGVIFADGIEGDYLEFVTGQSVVITLDEDSLKLVVPAKSEEVIRNSEKT